MNETTDWKNLIPNVVRQAVPALLGDREDHPRSMRWAADVAADVEELAKAEGQEFTTMALYLLKGAVAEMKAAKKRNGAKKATAAHS